jgi:hypothetical protein
MASAVVAARQGSAEKPPREPLGPQGIGGGAGLPLPPRLRRFAFSYSRSRQIATASGSVGAVWSAETVQAQEPP